MMQSAEHIPTLSSSKVSSSVKTSCFEVSQFLLLCPTWLQLFSQLSVVTQLLRQSFEFSMWLFKSVCHKMKFSDIAECFIAVTFGFAVCVQKLQFWVSNLLVRKQKCFLENCWWKLQQFHLELVWDLISHFVPLEQCLVWCMQVAKACIQSVVQKRVKFPIDVWQNKCQNNCFSWNQVGLLNRSKKHIKAISKCFSCAWPPKLTSFAEVKSTVPDLPTVKKTLANCQKTNLLWQWKEIFQITESAIPFWPIVMPEKKCQKSNQYHQQKIVHQMVMCKCSMLCSRCQQRFKRQSTSFACLDSAQLAQLDNFPITHWSSNWTLIGNILSHGLIFKSAFHGCKSAWATFPLQNSQHTCCEIEKAAMFQFNSVWKLSVNATKWQSCFDWHQQWEVWLSQLEKQKPIGNLQHFKQFQMEHSEDFLHCDFFLTIVECKRVFLDFWKVCRLTSLMGAASISAAWAVTVAIHQTSLSFNYFCNFSMQSELRRKTEKICHVTLQGKHFWHERAFCNIWTCLHTMIFPVAIIFLIHCLSKLANVSERIDTKNKALKDFWASFGIGKVNDCMMGTNWWCCACVLWMALFNMEALIFS